MKALTSIILICLSALDALAQVPKPLDIHTARQLLTGNGEREWQLETSETIALGRLCKIVPTYIFSVDGTLVIRECDGDTETEETKNWSVTGGSGGRVLLSIGESRYELYATTYPQIDFVLFQTPFEERQLAGFEFEISSKRE